MSRFVEIEKLEEVRAKAELLWEVASPAYPTSRDAAQGWPLLLQGDAAIAGDTLLEALLGWLQGAAFMAEMSTEALVALSGFAIEEEEDEPEEDRPPTKEEIALDRVDDELDRIRGK